MSIETHVHNFYGWDRHVDNFIFCLVRHVDNFFAGPGTSIIFIAEPDTPTIFIAGTDNSTIFIAGQTRRQFL